MSLAQILTAPEYVTFARSAAAAFISTCLALAIYQSTRANKSVNSSQYSMLIHTMLLALFIQPGMMTGYYYGHFVPLLIRQPWLNELLYLLLLIGKLVPWAYVAVLMYPPRARKRGHYLFQMLEINGRNTLGARLQLWLKSHAPSMAMTWLLMVFIAYHEFELASLLRLPNIWTEMLYVWYSYSPPFNQTIHKIVPAFFLQVAVLLVFFFRLHWHRSVEAVDHVSKNRRVLAFACLGVLLAFHMVIPWLGLWSHSTLAADGSIQKLVAQSKVVMAYCKNSWFVSFFAVVLAWLLVLAARCRFKGAQVLRYPLVLLMTLGLLGGLTLAIGLRFAFLNWAWLRPAYDTLLPWLTGLTILASPFIYWQDLLLRKRYTHAIHLVPMLSRSKVLLSPSACDIYWRLRFRPVLIMSLALIVFFMFEMPLGGTLHPVSTPPISHLLYNQMHYEATYVLSRQVLMSVLFMCGASLLCYLSCTLMLKSFAFVWQRIMSRS